MSTKETMKCEILLMADEERITQRDRAKRIGVTERYFRRLLHNFRVNGKEGIISGHRRKMSGNRM